MLPRLTDTSTRVLLSLILVAGVCVAIVAFYHATNSLFIHGFAVACSDGYAEAHGTEPCGPEWKEATPALIALGVAAMAVAAPTVLLLVGRTTPVKDRTN